MLFMIIGLKNVHLESLSTYNDIILFGFNWTIRN